jgi:hypothetical protein
MKKYFFFVLLCLASLGSKAKGGYGKYIIAGTMLEKSTAKPIANAMFVINNDTLWTDSLGKFNYPMIWATACPSGETRASVRRLNRKFNPKNISIVYVYNADKAKIRNRWKKYGLGDMNGKTETYSVTLYW